MFQSLEIFRMSHAMAKHAGDRQAIVAQNVANADTPGYKAQRMSSFSEVMVAPNSAGQKATRAQHMFGSGSLETRAEVVSLRGAPSPDGNTVSIEREMLESVNVKREHDRALSIYRSSLKILQISLGKV